MKAVVVSRGKLMPGDAARLEDADLVIAADGGADWLDRIGRRPDLVVGDLDSIDPGVLERLTEAGVEVRRHPADKDASDTELALDAALEAGASEVILLGGIGGDRLDHELANVLLLADPALGGTDVRLVRGETVARVAAPGPETVLDGRPGDAVTLLPIAGDAEGIRTAGLRWQLKGDTLRMGRSRGLSNEIAASPASVGLDAGALLVIETSMEEPES